MHPRIRRNRCNHNPARSTADPVKMHRNHYMRFLNGFHFCNTIHCSKCGILYRKKKKTENPQART